MHSGGERRQGTAIGNLRVRRGRRRQQVVQVRRPRIRKPRQPGVASLFIGILVLIAAGTGLLMLPPMTADGQEAATLLRAFFTATSAVCVTGLVVTDTRESWSTMGQVVILLLIQVGGLGFMTSSTLLLLVLGRRLSLAQRLVTGEVVGRLAYETPRVLIRRIVTLVLVTEAVGAVVLITLIALNDRSLSPSVLWRGLFTAVSAFNNAGFDIESGVSLQGFAGNPAILVVVAVIATLGSVGYAVLWDVGQQRNWRGLTLNSKIVLLTFAVLAVGGGLVIFLQGILQRDMASELGYGNALIASFAESAYARTSGFTALDLGGAQPEILLFIAGLMFIGGASGSTAGGIKVNTFSTLLLTIIASVRGEEHVHAFGREIPWRQVNRALTVALLSVAIAFVATFALYLTTDADPSKVLFEAVSAFGTTGLSTGITGSMNTAGQIVIAITMFIGRVGPLTIALALAARFQGHERLRYPEADVNIG